MSNRHRTGRTLLIGSGIALVIALPLLNGCSSGDDVGASELSDSSSVEAEDAMSTAAPLGVWTCHVNLKPRSIVVLPGPFGNNSCSIAATEVFGSSNQFCVADGCLPCSYLQKQWDCPTR